MPNLLNHITSIDVQQAIPFSVSNPLYADGDSKVFKSLKAGQIVLRISGELFTDVDQPITGTTHIALSPQACAYLITHLLVVVPDEVLRSNGLAVEVKTKNQQDYEF